MRFTESKKRIPFVSIALVVIVIIAGFLCFCEFQPSPKTVQKTIVFEAD